MRSLIAGTMGAPSRPRSTHRTIGRARTLVRRSTGSGAWRPLACKIRLGCRSPSLTWAWSQSASVRIGPHRTLLWSALVASHLTGDQMPSSTGRADTREQAHRTILGIVTRDSLRRSPKLLFLWRAPLPGVRWRRFGRCSAKLDWTCGPCQLGAQGSW
jgi:hypothetical protein